MDALHSVSVAKVAELLDLNNLTKEMNLKERAIELSLIHISEPTRLGSQDILIILRRDEYRLSEM